MKRILFFILLITSLATSAQIRVCQLPQVSSGTVHDWIIKEDSSCNGTRKMTIADFISTYGLSGGGGGGTGTVTSVATGYALLGGTITTTGTLRADTSVLVNKTGTQTLTNKTISGSSNTLTNIGNSSLVNSTISGVSLGSNLFSHAAGYGLTGSTFNGSAAQTWKVDTSTSTTNPATQGFVIRNSASKPITLTYDSAVTLYGAGTLIEGQRYDINDSGSTNLPYPITLIHTVAVRDLYIGNLTLGGLCTANSSLVTNIITIDFDFQNNWLKRYYDPVLNIDITKTADNNWDFLGHVSMQGVSLHDPQIVNTSGSGNVMQFISDGEGNGYDFNGQSNVSLNKMAVGSQNIFTVGASGITISGIYGNSNSLIFPVSVTNCTIGNNKTASFLSAQDGKIWVGGVSTFSEVVDVDIYVSSYTLDVSAFNYAGEVLLVSGTAATVDILGFSNWGTETMKRTFLSDVSGNICINNNTVILFPSVPSSTSPMCFSIPYADFVTIENNVLDNTGTYYKIVDYKLY